MVPSPMRETSRLPSETCLILTLLLSISGRNNPVYRPGYSLKLLTACAVGSGLAEWVAVRRLAMTATAAVAAAASATLRIHGRFNRCPKTWSSDKVPGPVRASAAELHPEDRRVFKAPLAVEEAALNVHRGGNDHRPSHGGTGARSTEPDCE
jgi:hypothetical protein